jgi:dihydroorotate dehydrogenase
LMGIQALGFSFVEVGTVTPKPQPGNPKPRLFRLPDDRALINRLGFNSSGLDAAERNLSAVFDRPGSAPPVGVNIGKNRDTAAEEAVGDYASVWSRLARFATYGVVNVSSPNTPGLRDLQSPQFVREVVGTLREVAPKPLLIKLSPDEPDSLLVELTGEALAAGAAGVVLTNTTVRREGLRSKAASQEGGLSGAPLRARATEAVRVVRRAHPSAVIIGVGGIFTGWDLLERIEAGADLCQVYTAFVYRGPSVVKSIVSEALRAMEARQVNSIASLRG